jgi:hypothetical protein
MKKYILSLLAGSALLFALNDCVTNQTTTTSTTGCSRTVSDTTGHTPVQMCAAQNLSAKDFNQFMPAKILIKKEGPVAVAYLPKRWPNGSALKVGFMDNDYALKGKVMAKVQQWSNYANITFTESSAGDADIRISFRGSGYWSVIGTDAKKISKNEQTMNLEFWNGVSDSEVQRVTLHEFGHALGLLHEHESPLAQIPWNKDAVYKYYMGPPNCWSHDEVDQQVLDREKAGPDLAMTSFDKDSIMCYPVDPKLTDGHYEIGWNNTLSETDKTFIAKLYPK